ncbi:MAG TPA: phosphate ABC transporter permease PstA [Solirubrobacteraceae bacterium]|jgi:phosphate transport system permease protein|nr:phosphate ABC transporter permease PstA [Solirubrobacteraceae bacterium]
MSAAAPAAGGINARYGVSARRRRTDVAMRGVLLAGTAIALVPLLLIIYYLLHKGLSSMTSGGFFTSDPTGASAGFFGGAQKIGGIKSALLGTVEIVLIASAIAVPIGIGVALWLVEYGRNSVYANIIRFFVDVLTGVPSIVFGLFIYIVLIVGTGSTYAGWKGSVTLSLLMLPIVIRSAEVVLSLVPGALRESALALGAPRWRVIFKVVLPTAASGMVTGVLLAVARAAGETAPLLFTAGVTNVTTLNPTHYQNSLPLQIYNDFIAGTTQNFNRAWGAALTLVLLILIVNLSARFISSRSRLG